VCRSAVRQTKTDIPKKQNEKITVAMALGPARLSLRIATTASSRCRGGHVRDLHMFRDSGVIIPSCLTFGKKALRAAGAAVEPPRARR
jgi:hypothetical protein